MSNQTYFAHAMGDDQAEWPLLRDHLANTAQLAFDLGVDAKVSAYAAAAARLHDIGKYAHAFQRRLSGAPARVDHSTAGAQEMVKLLRQSPQRMLGTILAYCIAGHHGGLPDYDGPRDSDAESTLRARLRVAPEDYSAYHSEIDHTVISLPAHLPIRLTPQKRMFSLAFFTRMVYSALVDADFRETEIFTNGGKKPHGDYADIPALAATFNHFWDGFGSPQGLINQLRAKILQAGIARSVEPPGFFSLTAPAGGGKTFAALGFALNHALIHSLKRIVYVLPYTSVIEQNATEFKRVLGYENVLEHHSHFDWESSRRQSDWAEADEQTNTVLGKLKLAAEPWDAPIIVTTNVQFFESLYADGSSRCRKLHNLAKSVMIFDEAQMLPRDYMEPCILAVHELVRNYGASALFCSATQPEIQRFLPADAKPLELAQEYQTVYQLYRRVHVRNVGKLADDAVIERMNSYLQALCIVNTRRHARGLFDGLAAGGRFHLSSLMCAAHRKAVIAEIRARLLAGQPCRVISTQIMEAGIDVDFPVGYRSISGLDSIIQAAGRVNREGQKRQGELFVFEPDSEFVERTPAYIEAGAAVARLILSEYPDPIGPAAIAEYYKRLYNVQDPGSFDRKDIVTCFEKEMGLDDAVFEFRAAARRFKLVENDTRAVMIPWDERARGLLEQARESRLPWQLGRDLQPYAVNIYTHEYQTLADLGLIDSHAEIFSVLNNMDFYDCETGLSIPESRRGEAVFFDG